MYLFYLVICIFDDDWSLRAAQQICKTWEVFLEVLTNVSNHL